LGLPRTEISDIMEEEEDDFYGNGNAAPTHAPDVDGDDDTEVKMDEDLEEGEEESEEESSV